MLGNEIGCIYLFESMFSFSLDKYLGLESCGLMVVLLNFSKKLHTIFHGGCTGLYSHSPCRSAFTHPQPALVISCLFVNSHSMGGR